MFIILLCLFPLCLNYTKLKKHGSVKVKALTKVYFDISSFKTGKKIPFEFIMDYFFADGDEKNRYRFHIGQVSASSYSDSTYWDNLPLVENRNLTDESLHDYVFSWEEIKQEGKKYIFIIPLEPYSGFTFFDEKVKIKHTWGLSSAEKRAIILGIILPAIIIIIILAIRDIRKRRNKMREAAANFEKIQAQQASQQQIYPQQQIYQPQIYLQQPNNLSPGFEQPNCQKPNNATPVPIQSVSVNNVYLYPNQQAPIEKQDPNQPDSSNRLD